MTATARGGPASDPAARPADLPEGIGAGRDPQNVPAGGAMTGGPERLRRALIAAIRDELLGPADAIAKLSEALVRDAREGHPESLIDDLRRIHDAGRRLTILVGTLLSMERLEERPEDISSARHDLRNLIGSVIGYCGLWLEDGDVTCLGHLVGDLRRIHDLSTRVLTRIDDILRFPTSQEGLAPSDRDGLEGRLVDILDAIAPPARDASSAQGPRPGSVLVVDDSDLNRDLLSRLLQKRGHAVAVAPDGRRALEMVASMPFDLILLDIMMPEINGLEVLARLKGDPRTREIPVIMISALDDIEGVAHCIERGAEDYLSRPFNPVLLDARIGACLEKKLMRDREAEHLRQIEAERKRSDELLLVILPEQIVDELKRTDEVRPRRYEDVAVLFADVVGFTSWSDRHEPEEVVARLQELVRAWEQCTLSQGMLKIKTIGDAYMAAAGLLSEDDSPVLSCARCGLEMIEATRRFAPDWDLRVGVHVGAVVAGVLGTKRFAFDIWGDTVNTASRMESNGAPGKVSLSEDAWRRIAHLSSAERSECVVKGKGTLPIYRLNGPLGDVPRAPSG
jgi:adenylate cyclase